MKRTILKKFLVLAMLILATGKLVRYYDQNRLTDGSSMLWAKALVLNCPSIMSIPSNTQSMTNYIKTSKIGMLKNVWGPKNQIWQTNWEDSERSIIPAIEFKPVEEIASLPARLRRQAQAGEELIDWQDWSVPPKCTFYYQEVFDQTDNKNKQVIADMRCNVIFAAILNYAKDPFIYDPSKQTSRTKDEIIPPEAREVMNAKMDTLVENLRELGEFGGSEYHDRYQPSVYSRAELRSLRTFAWLNVTLDAMILAGLDKHPRQESLSIANDIRREFNTVRGNWPLAYYQYLSQYKKPLVIWENIKRRVLIPSALLGIILLSIIHFFCRSLHPIIQEEVGRANIAGNRWMVWKVKLRYWRFLLWPLRRPKKVRAVIAQRCQHLKEKEEQRAKQAIAIQAQALWTQHNLSQSHPQYKNLLTDLRIATGETDHPASLAERKQALIRLKEGLEKCQQDAQEQLSQTQTPVIQPVVATTEPASLGTSDSHLSEREQVLQRVKHLLRLRSARFREVCDDLSLQNLECLERALPLLLNIPAALTALFDLRDIQSLQSLLMKDCSFMMAVEAGNRSAVAQTLGLTLAEQDKAEEEDAQTPDDDNATLLEGVKVIVVGGDKSGDQKANLTAAVLELGAKSCTFLDVDDDRGRLGDAAHSPSGERRLFISMLGKAGSIPHEVKYRLEHAGATVIRVQYTNPRLFQQEVAEKFRELTRQAPATA